MRRSAALLRVRAKPNKKKKSCCPSDAAIAKTTARVTADLRPATATAATAAAATSAAVAAAVALLLPLALLLLMLLLLPAGPAASATGLLYC